MASLEADSAEREPASSPCDASVESGAGDGTAREILLVDHDIIAELVAADGHVEIRRGGMTVILGERFASHAAARAAAVLFVRAYRKESVAPAHRRARSRRKAERRPH